MKLLDNLHWPGVTALGLILIAIVLVLLFAPPDLVGDVVKVLAGAGAGGALLPSLFRSSAPKPPAGPIAGALVLLAVLVSAPTLSGCGAGALGTQADLVTAGAIVWTQADTGLVQMRAHDLDGIVDAAREECGGGSCTEERRTHWREQLAAAEARWAPAMACREIPPASLRSWIDGIDTARAAQDQGLALTMLGRLGGRFALDYVAFAACVDAAAPADVPIPAIPPELDALARMLTTDVARTAGGEAGAP